MNFTELVNYTNRLKGESYLYLTCSATSDWTDQFSVSVGTTTTSGIYHMKSPGIIHAVSAAADAAAIIYLPPAAKFPGGICGVYAPTGATGGDISVYDWETGAEITTYGDLDADGDHAVWLSMGFVWVLIFDGVA
jgi:hypothetical protein